MPEAKLILKEPNSKEPTLIYLIFRFDNLRYKQSTGIKIHPKFWNDNLQLAKETRQNPLYEQTNLILKDWKAGIEKSYMDLLANKVPVSLESLRAEFNPELTEVKVVKKLTFLDFIDTVISTSLNQATTIKQYNSARTRLKEYSDHTGKTLYFEDISIDFYEDYVSFLLTVKSYSTNTISGMIKKVKYFMGEAVERGLTTNAQFRSKKFKAPQEAAENIYLTQEDINKIIEQDFSQNKRLDKVRDLFIIGCYTGLRFSDLSQLTNDNLIDNSTKLRIKTQKTGELVVIPLHPSIRTILTKYNGLPPEPISNQKMNEYLKEIGEASELNETVLINSTKGGKRLSELYKKYELISVHTARRSFATNAYLNEVPTISIMKITGHKTERAFLTYIKISQEDNANKLLDHPFFK